MAFVNPNPNLFGLGPREGFAIPDRPYDKGAIQMTGISLCTLVAIAAVPFITLAGSASASDQVKTANGILEGTSDPSTGIRTFRGIPFASPPIGDLRWKAPQPVKNWQGVRRADKC